MSVKELAMRAKEASYGMASASVSAINEALDAMSAALTSNMAEALKHNQKDILQARLAGMSSALVDRLTLSEARINGMAEGIRKVAALPSPVSTGSTWRRPNGLIIERRRVPFGLVGVIYESRPNVTADVAALCLKAGNACLLRGGKEALNTNLFLSSLLRGAIKGAGLPEDALCFVDDPMRESAGEMMRLRGVLDLLIPRGGASLIQTVVEQSHVPVIETGTGNCHVYADALCDREMAAEIIANAKCSRPSVCNAAETLLVHKDCAAEVLPRAKALMDGHGVELRGCERTREILGDCVLPVSEEDYMTEFLDFVLAVRVVDSMDEAIRHIARYGSGHSECIVTGSLNNASAFTDRVDAAAVYVNASTRFTDGEEFGMGAEIGISTAKLHARGPMGLEALTCDKYVIHGQGQIR